MKALRKTWNILDLKERTYFAFILGVRLFLVSFDLAGIFLVGLVVSLATGTNISPTSPVAKIASVIASEPTLSNPAILAGIAVSFFILKGLLSVCLNLVSVSFVARIEVRKAEQAFKTLAHSDLTEIQALGKNKIIYALTSAINAAFAQTLNLASGIFGEVALLITVSVYLFYSNPMLFLLVALFFGGVGVVMQAALNRLSHKSVIAGQDALHDSQTAIANLIDSFVQIKASGKQEAFVKHFSHQRQRAAKADSRYSIVTTLPRYITEVTVMLGVVILLVQRSIQSSASLSTTTIAIFLAGIFRIVASMLPLQSGITGLRRALVDGELAFTVLSGGVATQKRSQPIAHHVPRDNQGLISLRNLGFRYSETHPWTFRNVTLNFDRGAYVAIIGKSGAGKSTLVDVLVGARRPTEGAVMYAGESIESYREIRGGRVAYVPQKVELIAGTIEENIALNVDGSAVEEQQLRKAIRASGLADYISQTPEGLQSRLGAGQSFLSGGQLQRIGFARAIYSDPDVIVLDEVTSALDSETENIIRQAIEALGGKCTVFVIAHRIETLGLASTILRIDSGSISTHKTLEEAVTQGEDPTELIA